MTVQNRKIIHKSIDNEGIIEVIDDYSENTRSLYFGTPSRQSCMHLDYPYILVLPYTQYMMASLLFTHDPGSVLLVGLGGGSIAKFILHNYPDCKIDAIEKRENVEKLAYGYFKLPQTSQINIYTGDCSNLLTELSNQQQTYDIIFLDAFTGSDISDSLCSQHIYDTCRNLIGSTGVVSINLWTKSPNYRQTVRMINNSFNNYTLRIPASNKRNTILFALPGNFGTNKLKKLKTRSAALSDKLHLPVHKYLNELIKKNGFIRQLFAKGL